MKFSLEVELPNELSCEECPMLSNDEWYCNAEGEPVEENMRPEWCPLMEIKE